MSFRAVRGLPTVLVGMLLIAVLFTAYTAQRSLAQQPADKIAVSGSDIDTVSDSTPIITETMRVSSPSDLILSVTAECSIITELTTGGDAADSSSAFGSVRLRVTIDGHPVPVASDESAESEDDAADDDDSVGEVTFCNRAYGRTVEDTEGDGDVDKEDDFIRTRTANAFNWIALNAGTLYDEGNDNILEIQVLADFDTATTGDAVADAFVGSRTLVVEPGHFAVNETVDPEETGGPGNGNK